MNTKLKLYKEICLFIKQNGTVKNGKYEIEFDDKSYSYTKGRGLTIIDESINTYFLDLFTVKKLTRDFNEEDVSLISLSKIMRDLKQNINKFLSNI